jgi:glycosyltransferase involved in cell wall biosynthesis
MNFKDKRVLYLTGETIPSFRLNGSTLATIGLCLKLVEESQEFVAVTFRETQQSSPESILEELKGFNIDLHILEKTKASGQDIFGDLGYLPGFQSFIDQYKPEVIIGYDWAAVALIDQCKSEAIKISLTCDLRHLAVKERALNYFRKNKSFRSKLYNLKSSISHFFKTKSNEVSVLENFDLNINHAHHHADWLRKRGAKLVYLPQFIRIPGSEYRMKERNKKFRIMLAGNVSGVISIRGLEMLIFHIIPALKAKKGFEFEVNYYGHYDEYSFGPKLKKALDVAKDVFTFQGFKPLKEAILTHDVFMIPNNISLGFRTRIVEGMAYGACMLAHKANSFGMPELKHKENILIAETPEQFVLSLLELADNPELFKKIQNDSYNAYLNTYSVDVTFQKMLDLIS